MHKCSRVLGNLFLSNLPIHLLMVTIRNPSASSLSQVTTAILRVSSQSSDSFEQTSCRFTMADKCFSSNCLPVIFLFSDFSLSWSDVPWSDVSFGLSVSYEHVSYEHSKRIFSHQHCSKRIFSFYTHGKNSQKFQLYR